MHAAALNRGNADATVCTDCHGEHTILKHLDPRAPVAPSNVSAQVCSPCHSSIRLSQKYGISSDRFQSFSDSYHGLAIRRARRRLQARRSGPAEEPAGHALYLRMTIGERLQHGALLSLLA